ncbi:hypothetical protein [Tahibacter soli]|uniref:Tail assembly chaperone n=1 Tax=Tahibacter soli TaxID=2983605 RepID=A0A9X4BHJ7_9GAMM|nr:hypothetical protein [Tahibacter soli]MDC8012941.1 hypothetical protein [Tahibacter soli]
MKLKKSNNFTVDVKYSEPGSAPGTWRNVEFKAEFKTVPGDEQDALKRDQEERGVIVGLLDRVLVDVFGVETDERKDDGTPYTPVEIVKVNQLASQACVLTFWDNVNRDVEAKNSKRSRKP